MRKLLSRIWNAHKHLQAHIRENKRVSELMFLTICFSALVITAICYIAPYLGSISLRVLRGGVLLDILPGVTGGVVAGFILIMYTTMVSIAERDLEGKGRMAHVTLTVIRVGAIGFLVATVFILCMVMNFAKGLE